MKTEITKYNIVCHELPFSSLKIAFASDLHNRDIQAHASILDKISDFAPDIITIPGDLTARLDLYGVKLTGEEGRNENGFSFLREAVKIAPTFYSLGNHERSCCPENAELISDIGAHLLDNSYISFRKNHSCGAVISKSAHPAPCIYIGGLSSGGIAGDHTHKSVPPDLSFVTEFAKLDGYKLLLSHHPEYYPEYIRPHAVDLTLSGHAHGGQWRVFNHGIYAPGQGIFPKYTCGFYEDRMIVSRGLNNISGIPRIFDPYELILIEITTS